VKVFFQGKDESIVINEEITVTVLDIDGDEVVLGIEAPKWVEIDDNEPNGWDAELEECGPLQPR
jgi:carbon storage regulator CsrA